MASQYDDDGVVLDNDTGSEIRTVEPTGGLQPVVTAEINQAVATAHMYPRRRDREITNEIMGRATLDEDIASECNYSLKRGDKAITGPSIRFAEIVRASFGNIRVAARFVALDMADPERAAVVVEAVALDLETNNSEIIPVRRSIMTSGKGNRKPQVYSADMINMTMNAGCSIARRNAILAVVPKALWIGPYQRVIKVLQGDVDTLAARRVRMIDAFGKLEVSAEMLFTALGVKDASDIRVDHMPIMIGMMTAIKDGEAIDSVLGRMGSDAPVRTAVASPLRDDAPKTEVKQETKKETPKADSISTGPQKSEPEKVAEKSVEKVVDKPKPTEKPVEKTVEKAAPTETGSEATDGYGDEDSYMAWMQWRIDHGTSATELKDAFAKSRADRRELLSADNLEKITHAFNAKYGALMAGGDDA